MRPNELRDRRDQLKMELAQIEQEIVRAERGCAHKWGKPEQKSMRQKGYTLPAQYLGSDSRPEMHIPAETIVWWERKCEKCGKVDKTTYTEPTGEVRPVF